MKTMDGVVAAALVGVPIDSSPEKRRISSSFQSQEVNDLSNSENYVSSQVRKDDNVERITGSLDKWKAGGDDENRSREKEAQKVKLDSEKLKLRETMIFSDVGSMLKGKKEEKRRFDKDANGREGMQIVEKKPELQLRAYVRGVTKKRDFPSEEDADKDRLIKRRKHNSEKDFERVIHKMVEGSSDTDRYRDAPDIDHMNLPSKGNTVNDGKHRDERHMAGNHDDEPRLKGAQGRQRTADKDDYIDSKPRGFKDQRYDVEKSSASDGGQSDSGYAYVDATSIRNRHSPSLSSHATRDQYSRYKDMPVNVDEKMLKDLEEGNILYVEVSKPKVGSTTEISSGSLFSTIGDYMLHKVMSLYMKLKKVFVMKKKHSPTLADGDYKKEALHSYPIEDLELVEINPNSLENPCVANKVNPCDEKLDELSVITSNNSELLSEEKFGGGQLSGTYYTALEVDPSLEEGRFSIDQLEVSSNGECHSRMDNYTWNADQIDTVGTHIYKRLRTPPQRYIDEISAPTLNPIKKSIKRGAAYISKSSELSDKIKKVLHTSCDGLVTEIQYEGNRVLKSGENSGRRNKISWSMSEVEKLIDGVSLHGVGSWSRIKEGFFLSSPHRTRKDLKDKWRNLSNAMYIQTENNRLRRRRRRRRFGLLRRRRDG